MKRIAVLGATGSIGTTTLNIIEKHREQFCVSLIVNNTSIEALKILIEKFKPSIAICVGAKYMYAYGKKVPFVENILEDSTLYNDSDIVVNGIVGLAGLKPTLAVLNSKATLATANKESFVCAGSFICQLRDKNNKKILPLDSEHSTIFQCLQGNFNYLKSIVLTASGGAFRNLKMEELAKVTAKDALKHPTWVMGKKVTIDCATLVNKGMEIIEAKYLFGCDNIRVIRHDESIIHSLIELKDNSMIAGLSNPDMTIPIQYALSYPERIESSVPTLDLAKIGTLHFSEIDEEKFPCFGIAKEVALKGDVEGTIFTTADEVLVTAFMQEKIGFYDISNIIKSALDHFCTKKADTIEDIFCMEQRVREYTLNSISKIGGK
ncbi:MAG: 1-deoxy-D-xylulose-5-phosphate reductoisomerase [Clostridia bacterium]